MSRQPGTFRSGDRAVHRRRPSLVPLTVTGVFWSTFGDWITVDINGVEAGPFRAENYQIFREQNSTPTAAAL